MPTDVPAATAKYQRKTLFVKMARTRYEDLRVHRGLEMDLRIAAGTQVAFNQDKLRDLLDGLSLFVDLRHQYMAYALALDRSQARMDFMVDLIREHQILRNRFEGRGLDPDVLDKIDELVIYRTGDR